MGDPKDYLQISVCHICDGGLHYYSDGVEEFYQCDTCGDIVGVPRDIMAQFEFNDDDDED